MPDLFLATDPSNQYATAYAAAEPAPGALSLAVPLRVGPVPTLEATHTWDDAIVLHDHRELGDVRWRLRCRSITLGSMPAATLPADPRVGGVGTRGRRGTRGGRIVTYGGAIEAVDAAALREASDALRSACWDISDDRPVTIEQDDGAWTFTGRPHADVTDNTSLSLSTLPTPYQAEFVVAISLNDPRVYSAGPVTAPAAVVLPASPGAALPWPSLPVVLAPRAPTSATGTVTILGGVPTPLTMRVHGPAGTPVLTDQARGLTLIVDVEIADRAWIDIDMHARTVTTSKGEDITTAVRWPASTWWSARYQDTPPGPLRLTVDFGGGSLPPARVDVTHYPAFP